MHIPNQPVGSNRMVHLYRSYPSNPRLNAYIIEVVYPVHEGVIQGGLVLSHNFDDFEPDGFAVFKESGLHRVEQDARSALWDTMLRGEGLLGALDHPPRLRWDSLASVIESIAATYHFLILECESTDGETDDFYLGELLDIDGEIVHFRTLNAMARWDDDPHEIPLNDITLIEFDTAYLRHFTKYIEA